MTDEPLKSNNKAIPQHIAIAISHSLSLNTILALMLGWFETKEKNEIESRKNTRITVSFIK